MSRRKRATLELGHDAFLDIVANLVGILIILVVVLGTQTQRITRALTSPDEIAQKPGELVQPEAVIPNMPTLATESQISELAQTAMQAAAAQRESNRLEKMIVRYDAELEVAKRERGALLDLLTLAEEAWAEKQKSLDEQKVRAAKLGSEMQEVSSQLAELAGTKERLENQELPVVAVEHLPTPMAKTVFGDEIHLRLKNNRLSVVPIEPLLEAIKEDFGRVIRGSRNGRSSSAVGPIRGYVAHYAMDKSTGRITQSGKTGMGTRVQLAGMVIEPLEEPHGQPIDQVLTTSRLLDVELAGRDPSKTTITVWVYPESFASFRSLKEHLYRRGFATAARPLPADRAITGGPSGSRSQAQ
ncbi:hypothetical protein LOC71_07455 [Rhodopirellula sp. JC740]|uniref:Chromosome partition protein Smc n=1 Tax=Rhodopirellula halodulae TaxID=2894198 RepID=A0ABS8NEX8_9BACT|nr:hypothetical protein [Rhodopirellula sp. JC740]MCC9642105.1 hypothetical protein [Rhodopirellula sp. JC740]